MQKLVDRLKEPSSWAGIAVLINLMAPTVGIPPGLGELIANAGASLAALAAVFLAEKPAA